MFLPLRSDKDFRIRRLRTGDYGWTSDHDIAGHWNEYRILMAPKMNLRISVRSTEDKNKIYIKHIQPKTSRTNRALSIYNHNFRKYYEVLTVKFQSVPV